MLPAGFDDADVGVMLLTTDSEEEAVRCAKMMDEKTGKGRG